MSKVSNTNSTISRTKVYNKLMDNKGKFFSCTFTKKDGSTRRLCGRLGVTQHLKGGVNKVQRPDNNYVTVWDREIEDYRTLNLATVTEINIAGQSLKVV